MFKHWDLCFLVFLGKILRPIGYRLLTVLRCAYLTFKYLHIKGHRVAPSHVQANAAAIREFHVPFLKAKL